jgi:hypothetical protein
MIRRSKEQWLSLFQQHADSGLTAAAFCKQYDLDQAYFSLRKTQLCSTDETAFVPVTREKKHNNTVTTSLKLQYHLESILYMLRIIAFRAFCSLSLRFSFIFIP